MSQKTAVLLAFLAFALSPAFGQATDRTPRPATSREVRQLDNKINKLLENQRNSDSKLRSITEGMEGVRKDTQGAKSAAEAANATGHTAVDAIRSESGKGESDRLSQNLSLRYILAGIAVLIMIGIAMIVLVRKNKGAEVVRETIVREFMVQQPSETNNILTNPTHDRLLASMGSRTTEEYIFCPDPDDETQFDPVVLVAHKIEGNSKLGSQFPGEAELISWKGRKKYAVSRYLRQKKVIEIRGKAS
jgi:hypothetical protein